MEGRKPNALGVLHMMKRTVAFIYFTQVMGLIEKDLSEPYSIFTYRYFINNWPSLCILVYLPLDYVHSSVHIDLLFERVGWRFRRCVVMSASAWW